MPISRREALQQIRQVLAQIYSIEDGWVFSPGERTKKYKFDLMLERKISNKSERVIVCLRQDGNITPLSVKKFNLNTRKMSGRYVKVLEKIIFVPEDSDISMVTPNITVRYLPGDA